jgi:hypothetical protein
MSLISPDPVIIGSEGGMFVHCLRLSFVPRVKVCTLVASLTYWNAPLPVKSASTHGPTFIHKDSSFLFSRFRKIAESDY